MSKQEILKTVGTVVMGIGFFLIFGAVGGIEAETLSLFAGTLETAIALALIIIGNFLESSAEKREGER